MIFWTAVFWLLVGLGLGWRRGREYQAAQDREAGLDAAIQRVTIGWRIHRRPGHPDVVIPRTARLVGEVSES